MTSAFQSVPVDPGRPLLLSVAPKGKAPVMQGGQNVKYIVAAYRVDADGGVARAGGVRGLGVLACWLVTNIYVVAVDFLPFFFCEVPKLPDLYDKHRQLYRATAIGGIPSYVRVGTYRK